MKKTILLFSSLIIFLSSGGLICQAQVLEDSVYSASLKETRHFQVVLPKEYKQGSSEKYDVVYLVDGDWNIGLMTQIQQWLNKWEFTPPVILVGIDNISIDGRNQRGRDLLPTKVSSQLSGGADRFLSFIKHELIPQVDKTYPTSRSNTLFGHSLGGLFTMYAFLSEPDLFDSYIAADPSFWWDHHFINQLALQKLAQVKGYRSLFITGRTGKFFHDMEIDGMDSVLRVKAPPTLHWKIATYPDETHVSAQFKSAYDGLKYAYTGYKPHKVGFTPMAGIIIKDKPYKISFDEAIARVAYTTDGSMPSETSPRMTDTLTLRGPARLTISTLCFHSGYNQSSSGDFVEGPVLPANIKPRKALAGGLHFNYYGGNWDNLPDFKKLRPLRSGSVGIDIDIDSLHNDRHFGLLVNGLLEIKEDGYYTFVFSTDDAGTFYLDNRALIRKAAGENISKSYMVPLAKGFYPLRIEYLHQKGEYNINLMWLTPKSANGDDPSSIPLSQLYKTE